MASGVLIQHPSIRNVTLLIPHPGDPATGRKGKDYHLRLDNDGRCIVSEVIWGRVREAEIAGGWDERFVLISEVSNPPSQGLTTVARGDSLSVPRTLRQEPGSGGPVWDFTEERVGQIRRAQEKSAVMELAPPGLHGRVVEHKIVSNRPDK
jgi:hypothetical protein